MTFTEKQIKEINARAKTGEDFPKRIQELKNIGVTKYDFMVEDGSCIYFGKQNFSLNASPAYIYFDFSRLTIHDTSSVDKLKNALMIHQQGKTNFPTFCQDAAKSGVYKWTCDLNNMVVMYVDRTGKILVTEKIPTVK